MSYEPLHHKYRPQTFADLIGQETIANTLTNALAQSKIAPAYLFTGPRGTGKTSSARILAKSLNCLESNQPTPTPCGKCEACLAIAQGTALDVIEIDAASNTGVDNIREIIERSRFAPVQCRYKVYAIDECLTGDSLIITNEGLMRIDNPNLKGKMALSYNENTKSWEYRRVLRWLERGTKETLIIKTSNRQICCTNNHLIRTETGWIEAKNVTAGMKILSPANVDVETQSTNMVPMDGYADSWQDISLRETNTEAKLTTLAKFSNKLKQYNPYVNVDVTKNLIFPASCKRKEEVFKVSNLTGKDIHTKKVTESGIVEGEISLILPNHWKANNWDSYTEHYSEMEASIIQIHPVISPDYDGHMENNSRNGWSIKQVVYNNCDQNFKVSQMQGMAKNQLFAEQLAILSYKKFMKLLSQTVKLNQFRWNGFNLLQQKVLPGGTWMTVLSNLVHKVALESFFTLRDFLNKKIKLLPIGLQAWDILLAQNLTPENLPEKLTTTSRWEQNLAENGCQICNNIQSPQWTTNLEKVESVHHAGHEKVYDLEVENNHNFVANGLLVHNCHMLSTAAFNALLKTLEEPPPNVIFILATTDPQRVLSTIISRCQRFDYRRIPLEEMVRHLQYIAKLENIQATDEAISLIAQIANGGLRDAESLLDQLSLLPNQITVEKVWDLVGAVSERDLLALLQAIRSDRPELVIQCCRNLLDQGREPLMVLQNLAGFYLNLLIAKTAPHLPNLVAVTEACWQELCNEAAHWEMPLIMRGQQQLKEAEIQLKNTTQPRLWLEVTLLSLLAGLNAPATTTPTSLPTATSLPHESNGLAQAPPEPKPPADKPKPLASPVKEVNSLQASKTMPKSCRLAPQTQTASSAIAENQSSKEPVDTEKPVPSVVNAKAVPTASFAIASDNSTAEQLDEDRTTPPTKITQVDHKEKSHKAFPKNQTSDPIANKQLWAQVIACLHPPTTKALLSQQCHLISFNGSSAVVGISSAKLQKLHQGKVTNIEAAFAQVCQSKVRVSLEVASAIAETEVNSSIADRQSIPTPKESSGEKATLDLSASVVTPDTVPPTTTTVNSHNQKSHHSPRAIAQNSTESSLPETNMAQASPETAVAQPQPLNLVESHHPKTELAQESLNKGDRDDSPEELQQAIENLTHSFEGEVVQLEDRVFAEEEVIEIENLPLPSNISLGNRPDLSSYEDEDDVPFLRPVYAKTSLGLQLCDSWELAANRYWDGIKSFIR